jgi:type I restriction enzyme R subunit
MTKSDTSERGLERLICTALTGAPCDPGAAPTSEMRDAASRGGSGWICGSTDDYDREYCVDLVQLRAFLWATQAKIAEALDLGQDGPTRRRFLARLQGEISKRGVIDVLRHGVKDGPHHIDLFYGAPSPSALPDSSAIAATRRSLRSTWACSSMVCPSPPLS